MPDVINNNTGPRITNEILTSMIAIVCIAVIAFIYFEKKNY